MKKINIILTFFFVLGTAGLTAQEYYFSLHYSTASPMGETSNYIDNYSWRGIGLEAHWFMNNQLSIGYHMTLNAFYQKVAGEFVDGTTTLTGTQLRYLNTLPILFEGRYHLGGDAILGDLRPYFGLGAGTIRTLQRTEIGIFAVENNNWQFGVAPAAGIIIPMANSAMLNLAVRYNYAVETGKASANSFLNINLGVVWAQ